MKSAVLLFLICPFLFTGAYSRYADVVFNEIMYDPDPVVGLPAYEYLELFNRTDADIDLEGWLLDVGKKEFILPGHTIAAKEFLLLAYPGTSGEYSGASGILECMKGKTLLLNEGEVLYLYDRKGNLIDWVEYSPAMHSDAYYRNGGWSLERIDPDRLCGGPDNWCTSGSREGGTPGRVNSVYRSNPDFVRPEVSNVYMDDSLTLVVVFSESMQPGTIGDASRYLISSGIPGILEAEVPGPFNSESRLLLDRSPGEGKEYVLEITGELTDCSGLSVPAGQRHRFARPAEPSWNDLLISEILFNPWPGCPEFIEIFNHAGIAFDIADLRIGSRDPVSGDPVHVRDPDESHRLVFPGDYFVFSREPGVLLQYYQASDPSRFVRVNSMPALDNKAGNIVILDKWLNAIDEFSYNADMHFPLLKNDRGVSLERLSFEHVTASPANWHSASSAEGFATPGRENSQFVRFDPDGSSLLVEPEIFSPDQDGTEDICYIRYRFSRPGNVISVLILDAKGRTIKRIARNELAGTEGFFQWDGTDMYGRRAWAGIYLVLVEVFDLKGVVRKFKKTCVLSPGT